MSFRVQTLKRAAFLYDVSMTFHVRLFKIKQVKKEIDRIFVRNMISSRV